MDTSSFCHFLNTDVSQHLSFSANIPSMGDWAHSHGFRYLPQADDSQVSVWPRSLLSADQYTQPAVGLPVGLPTQLPTLSCHLCPSLPSFLIPSHQGPSSRFLKNLHLCHCPFFAKSSFFSLLANTYSPSGISLFFVF